MVERLRISPVGCFGPRAWQEPLAQAQTILADLGLDPALGAVAHRVARLVPTAVSLPAFWLLLGVLVSESEGHSRVNLDGPAWPEPLAKAMGPWEPLREALLAGPLAVLVGPQERPLVVNGPWLSSQRLHASETRVALAVRTRLRQAQRMGQTA